MKNLLKSPIRFLTYVGNLLLYVLTFWILSFFILHQQLEWSPLLVYFGNIGLIIYVLVEDKVINYLTEWQYKKLKKEGFLKKYLRNRLADNRWRPSPKAGLYLYYMICLILGRVLLLGDGYALSNSYFVQSLNSYFSEMYYVLILFLGADKFKEYVFKESKYRDKYYRRYSVEEVEKKVTNEA